MQDNTLSIVFKIILLILVINAAVRAALFLMRRYAPHYLPAAFVETPEAIQAERALSAGAPQQYQ